MLEAVDKKGMIMKVLASIVFYMINITECAYGQVNVFNFNKGNGTLNWTAISTIGGFIGIIIAIIALICELRQSRFQHGIDLLMKLTEEFDGKTIRGHRQDAARGIKDGDFLEAGEVLDFFEMIALLVRKGAIDKYFVWHSFFNWIRPYYIVSQTYIKDCRSLDPSVWEDLIWLYNKLLEIEKRNNGCNDAEQTLTADEIDEFFNDELK